VIHTPTPSQGFSPQRGSISDRAATENNAANYQTCETGSISPAGQPPGGLNFQRYPGTRAIHTLR
jgi:hypothetical protein